MAAGAPVIGLGQGGLLDTVRCLNSDAHRPTGLLFHQQNAEPVPPLLLNREFLSDNVIRLLRDAHGRACDGGRNCVTPMDLLITLFTTPNSIVAECFERIGVTAAKLTELAVLAERDALAK